MKVDAGGTKIQTFILEKSVLEVHMRKMYNGNRKICGSWLMDEKALLSLEEVARNMYTYLYDVQENQIEKSQGNNEECNYYQRLKNTTSYPKINICFVKGSDKQVDSFKDIFDLLEYRECLVRKIEISFRCLGTKVMLTLSSGNDTSNYFEYEIIGSETFENYEYHKDILIGKIENWIDSYKPCIGLTAWYYLAVLTPIFCLLIAVVCLGISLMDSGAKDQYFKQYDSEIAQIVESEINDSNRDRAIQMILQKEYDYVPESWNIERKKTENQILLYCEGMFLFCLFIRIRPKANFAIGKGKRRIKAWNTYKYIIFILIPTSILIPILINRIS